MIDLHCHLLPHMDDGPQTWRDTMTMARKAVADGLTTIVCTPHVPDASLESPVLDAFSGRITAGVEELRSRLAQGNINLEVVAGAEVSIHLPPQQCRAFTINGGRYALIELPQSHLPAEAANFIFQLAVGGLTPIIAHPERHPCVIQQPDKILTLIRAGAFIQITGGSLLGHFGASVKSCAEYLLKRGHVSILASDAHSPQSRPPVLSKAVGAAARLIGWQAAAQLVIQNPQAILNGNPLPLTL